MNALPNSFQNFNSLSLNYLKFVTPKIWVLQVASCSATAASFGRRDGASSLAATSLRLKGRESRQAGGDRAGLSGGRRSHETVVGRIHHSSGFFFFSMKETVLNF
jgi:hypothetical protein